MSNRSHLPGLAPEAYGALRAVEAVIAESGLERRLLELVKIRASQINGCAFCLDMHSRAARDAGETAQRLDVLAGWHEAPFYTERERAALAWTERLTRLASDGAPEGGPAALAAQFSDREIGFLTAAVGMINLWNRVVLGLGVLPPVRS